jgi:hypothetical protein
MIVTELSGVVKGGSAARVARALDNPGQFREDSRDKGKGPL